MESEKYLQRLYDRLYNNLLLKKKKTINKSILLLFFEIKSNDRLRLLLDSSIKSSEIPFIERKELVSKEFIRETSNLNEFVITGKGIYEIENKNGKTSTFKLVDFLDNKLFSLFSEAQKDLSEKQKVILLSMVAGRSFSDKSTVDLKKSDKASEEWGNIIKSSYSFLKKYKIINKLTEQDLFGKMGNEHPVSNIFRHTDSLPKLTKAIFSALGAQKYFLNVAEDGSINKDKLKFIIEKIFSKLNMDLVIIDDIMIFLRDITYNKDIYIYEQKDHIFSNSKYDYLIKDILIEL